MPDDVELLRLQGRSVGVVDLQFATDDHVYNTAATDGLHTGDISRNSRDHCVSSIKDSEAALIGGTRRAGRNRKRASARADEDLSCLHRHGVMETRSERARTG